MNQSTRKNFGRIFLVIILSLIAGGALFYFSVCGLIHFSEPYQQSVNLIEKNESALNALGAPIKIGFFITGKIKLKKGFGEATMHIPVSGTKEEGQVTTHFYKENGAWAIDQALLYLAGSTDPLNLLSFSLTSVSFHSDSNDGPMNHGKIFELGDKVFINIVAAQMQKKKDGAISLNEGLTIFDENNKVILENKKLVSINEFINSSAVTFQNNALLPAAGVFKFVITVTDLYSGKVATTEESVTVKAGEGLKIIDFNFKSDSPDGMERENGRYVLGETIFVTFDLLGLTNKAGKISFIEDLYITDENDNILLEKKGILQANETWNREDVVSLHNEVNVPNVGKYKIKIVVQDRLNSKQSEKVERFEVVENKLK